MWQLYQYNEQPNSSIKETLKKLANSNMSDTDIKLVLSHIVNSKCQSPTHNSQFGDH